MTVDVGPIRFLHGGVLIGGGLVVLLLLLALRRERRARAAMLGRLGEHKAMAAMLGTLSPWRLRVSGAALVGAALLLTLTLARPTAELSSSVATTGLDVVLAMDVSKSMLVRDVQPHVRKAGRDRTDVGPGRLGRARELAFHLLDQLAGSRTAAMVFAGAAVHFPLTDDPTVSEQFLADIGPLDVSQGSDLAEAIRVGRCLLRPDLRDAGCARIGGRGHGGDPLPGQADPATGAGKPARTSEATLDADRSKAIVLFTDGGDPGDEAATELAAARALGIAVIFVGVGTPAGGEVFDLNDAGEPTFLKRDRAGQPIVSRRDDAALAALAERAGDRRRYVVASERGPVDPTPIVTLLREREQARSSRRVRQRRDVGEYLLFPAFLLLVLEAVMARRRRGAA